MYDNMALINREALRPARSTASERILLRIEMGSRTDAVRIRGKSRSFFASAVMPEGLVSFLPELLDGYNKVYVLNRKSAEGVEAVTAMIMEKALSRGLDVKLFIAS